MNDSTLVASSVELAGFQQGLAALDPAYFSLVMATGIISIVCHQLEMPLLARGMFWLNLFQYAVLWGLTAARWALFPKRFLTDLIDHERGVGFFTSVAATCVLGSECLLIGQYTNLAKGLWGLGILLWLVLTYVIFTAFAVKHTKPTLAEGIHGGWLVSVVGAQSVALLGSLLAPSFSESREQVLFFSLAMWLGGGMLYIWIISLIFYRYTFFPMSPTDLSPPYWINMGAMAISALAGATLLEVGKDSPLLSQLTPFLKGFTLLFWATATWWIPMLLILGVWRHLYMHFRLSYDSRYWGVVFPLGMYAACTLHVAQVMQIPCLFFLPRIWIYVALAAWCATFGGMLLALSKRQVRSA